MSVTKEEMKATLESKRDDIIPAKTQGFETVSVKLDLAGFDDPSQVLIIEAFAGKQRIAYMSRNGGPREQTNIVGQRIANPDTLVFETSSNGEHKGEITITTTIKGSDVAKQPFEVATR